MRILFTERYAKAISEAEEAEYELKGKMPPVEYDYRLIYIHLSDIFAVKQIPGKKQHCYIETYDERLIMVKAKDGFEEICQLIDDREAQEAGDLNIEGDAE